MAKQVQIDRILGIDQSINSTGICLHTIETVYTDKKTQIFHSYKYWIIASKLTKVMQKFENPWVTIVGYNKRTGDDYESKEAAKTLNIFDICEIIDSIFQTENVSCICMEGISYGSAGSASLVDLAGLNYCIRMTALRRGIPFHIVSPMSLKKEATGNGGADKDEMVWAWKQCDPNITKIKEIKIDDLADAFFLSKCVNK